MPPVARLTVGRLTVARLTVGRLTVARLRFTSNALAHLSRLGGISPALPLQKCASLHCHFMRELGKTYDLLHLLLKTEYVTKGVFDASLCSSVDVLLAQKQFNRQFSYYKYLVSTDTI